MKHLCHWPGCKIEVPPKLWGCFKHWAMLPASLRNSLWKHYRPGQEVDKMPSKEYREVAIKIREWIKENGLAGR